jgi:uncharacterized protein with HEPN domain
MAKRSPRERLLDIADCIAKIERFLAGQSYEVFRTNALIHDAVVRNLEIISEASRHVPEEVKAKEPGIPWREIRDFGNVLRHTYEGVNDPILWKTIQNDLPALSAAVHRLLRELG